MITFSVYYCCCLCDHQFPFIRNVCVCTFSLTSNYWKCKRYVWTPSVVAIEYWSVRYFFSVRCGWWSTGFYALEPWSVWFSGCIGLFMDTRWDFLETFSTALSATCSGLWHSFGWCTPAGMVTRVNMATSSWKTRMLYFLNDHHEKPFRTIITEREKSIV